MLDVGCGVGSFHPLLRGMVSRLSGIDVSSASIAQACADNRDVDYRAFDGRSFPYGDAGFDLATAICVLHHVAPAAWDYFITEMRRVVRPGGTHLRYRAQSAQSAYSPCRRAMRIRPRRRLARRKQSAEINGGHRFARYRRALFPAVTLGGDARAPHRAHFKHCAAGCAIRRFWHRLSYCFGAARRSCTTATSSL